jgi:cyclic lactone autoinducer peptide
MKKKLLSKAFVVSLLTGLGLFFAQTSAQACTILILDQPKIPKKLIIKD